MSDLKSLWAKAVQKGEDLNEIPGLMGAYVAGAKTVNVSGKPGWVHVRKGPAKEPTIARNLNAPTQWNTPIKLKKKNGVLTAIGVDEQRAIVYGGGGSGGGTISSVGPHTHRIGSGYEYELEMLRLEAGRVRPGSGMTVTINAFRYQKSDGTWDYWPGGPIDLTAYQPAIAGNHGWVLVGVDPSDNTAVAVAGDEYSYTTPLTPDLLDDITFTGYIPCGAVRVRADDTDLVNISRYQDAHGWFNLTGSGSGSSTFLDLTDTPAAFTSQAHKLAQVNADEDALEFTDYLAWVNVTDYGATGDGATDDTTSITNAIAAIPSDGGVLYFPPGEYVTSGGFTLANNTMVLGAGMGLRLGTDAITQVNCNSATAVLFTVTADWAMFRDIALKNTAAGTPTAGSAIETAHASSYNQRVDYENIAVFGFYDDIDSSVGAYWTMRGCQIAGPVRYGLRIRNTIEPDAGDWAISNTNFNTGSYAPDAAIRIESSGGGKINNVKVNQHTSGNQYNHGIDVNIGAGNGTSVFLVSNCSIENIRGNGINIDVAASVLFRYISIIGNQFGLYGNTTGSAILVNAAASGAAAYITILGNNFRAETGSTAAAVDLTNVDNGVLGGNLNHNFSSLLSETTCNNIETLGSGSGTDEKVKVSSNDTTGDYLLNKLAASGLVTVTETNDGGDEDATIGASVDAQTEETAIDGVNDEALFYDNSAAAHRKIPPWRFQSSSRMVYAQTATQTIASTTTETTLFGDGVGTLTIPANSLLAGSVIRISAMGELGDTGTPSPTLKITLGGATIATVTPTLTGVTDVRWMLEASIHIRTIGATGTAQGGGLFDYDDGTESSLLSAADVTIDTTGTLDVDVTWTWDVSDASNTIESRMSRVKVLNPPPGSVTAGASFRISESGDSRITEASDTRVSE